MALEAVTYIPELNQSNPVGATDPKSEGDDHLRNIKKALLNSFGAFVGTAGAPKSVTLTEDQINDAAQKGATQTISGAWTFSGLTTHSGRLVTDDSTTSRAGFNIPDGVAPTSPVQGDIWATATDLFIRNDGQNKSLLSGGVGTFAFLPPNGNVSLTNQSSALVFFANDNDFRTKMDLSPFTQIRMFSHVVQAGFAGSFHEVRYFTSFSTAQGDYLTIGSSAVRNVHTSTGLIDTGWINLVAGAIIDNAFLALVMDDGDNTADPIVRQVVCHFR